MTRRFTGVMLLGPLLAALTALAATRDLVTVRAGSVAQLAGSETTLPLAGALALVALAAWGVLLVIRGAARRVLAGLALLALLGTLATLLLGIRGLVDGDHSINGWYWTALAAAVLASGCAVLAVPFSPTWPAMSGRYDAPGSAAEKTPESDADLWKAQDQGQDPS